MASLLVEKRLLQRMRSRGAPETSVLDPRRLRTLQGVGMLCGITAGAWLGAAEAPTKLVTLGLSPVVISLSMVIGVFLARWTLPALIQGTSYVAADLRQAPHLIVWAVLAGCLWAVANTLTIFAVRDVGLSIAFPLWNSNSLLGIIWGVVFFHELRGADWRRWLGVLGGAFLMFAGATALAAASAAQGAIPGGIVPYPHSGFYAHSRRAPRGGQVLLAWAATARRLCQR